MSTRLDEIEAYATGKPYTLAPINSELLALIRVARAAKNLRESVHYSGSPWECDQLDAALAPLLEEVK